MVEKTLFEKKNGYPDELKKVDRKSWPLAAAIQTNDSLIIQGRSVMESWQLEYMTEFAKAIGRSSSRVLEVGFGMGLFASAIQKHPIDEHVVIESNKSVFSNLENFARTAVHKVVPVFGMWQSLIKSFPDESFDGIFFDASPFDERELHYRQFDFGKEAYRLLKQNGIYSYCNLCSIGGLRYTYNDWNELFEETQLPYLQECGFNKVDFKIISVNPPEGDVKYPHKQAMIPIAKK